jgi:hypothetical protein
VVWVEVLIIGRTEHCTGRTCLAMGHPLLSFEAKAVAWEILWVTRNRYYRGLGIALCDESEYPLLRLSPKRGSWSPSCALQLIWKGRQPGQLGIPSVMGHDGGTYPPICPLARCP